MAGIIKILVVEDHVILREGLVSLLNPQADFNVVGEAGSVEEAIRLARELKPDLVLMDFSLPDGTGVDATRAILAENPAIDIVFLTVHADDDDLFDAIRSGAKGYLLKNIPVAKMVAALRGLQRGEAPLSREMTSRLITQIGRGKYPQPANSEEPAYLTHREIEVLALLANGASNQEIADQLFISINTVKNHIHNMLGKLELKNRKDLRNYATQHHLTKKR